jgi:hypothetical protein
VAKTAIVTYKSLAPDTAFELAKAALDCCRKDGYQVAVIVLDRFGAPLVGLRDRLRASAPGTSQTERHGPQSTSRLTPSALRTAHSLPASPACRT